MDFGPCTETRHPHFRKVKGRPPIPIKCPRNANGHVFGGKSFVIVDGSWYCSFPMYKCIMCGTAVAIMYPCIRDGKRL